MCNITQKLKIILHHYKLSILLINTVANVWGSLNFISRLMIVNHETKKKQQSLSKLFMRNTIEKSANV